MLMPVTEAWPGLAGVQTLARVSTNCEKIKHKISFTEKAK